MLKTVKCPYCQSLETVKNGKFRNIQRLRCKGCNKYFRFRYKSKAHKAGVHSKVIKLLDKGHSIRVIARSLKISPTTVFTIKQKEEQSYQEKLNRPYPILKNVLHVILFSGGKDSTALIIWALEHLPKDKLRFIFCDTGWESSITYQFIQEVNHSLLDNQLIILKSKKYDSLPDLAKQKGRFPSPKARFCTEQLKIIPTIEWILEQKEDIAIYQGIRAAESQNRSRMKQRDEYFKPQILYSENPYQMIGGEKRRKNSPIFYRPIMNWLEEYDCSVERPLFHWKQKEILDLCRKHELLNPLYDMGLNRVGCFPCIMENKAGIKIIAEQFPDRITEIEAIEQGFSSTFFGYGKVPDSQCKYPNIRDVTKWATKNEHQEISKPEESSCMSHYQNCE